MLFIAVHIDRASLPLFVRLTGIMLLLSGDGKNPGENINILPGQEMAAAGVYNVSLY